MCLSCGMSNYSGAVFHVTCHGFFKALLFLATGCLVGRCLLEQNHYILGGLNKVSPLPQIFILSGSLSVVGYPSLTGSYSKDYLIYSGFHSYLYDSYFLYLQATVGVVTTGRYSTRLLYLVFIRTKVSVTLPILVFGEGTGILAVNPLPLMVSTGVLGFVSSEPFTGIGSDYLFDALQFSGGTSAVTELEFCTFIVIPFLGLKCYRTTYKPSLLTIHKFI